MGIAYVRARHVFEEFHLRASSPCTMAAKGTVVHPGESSVTRVNGLGTLSKLSDLLIIMILGSLDAKSLAKRVPLVSKAFYIFSNFDELWKDLTITERRVLVFGSY